jgi:hypothetical protein
MKISKLYHGGEECNTYVLGEEGQPCVVVDPGYNENGSLDNYIEKHHGYCLGYLITHGHCDHIAGLKSLTHQATVFLMAEDEECLHDPDLNVSRSLFGKAGLVPSSISSPISSTMRTKSNSAERFIKSSRPRFTPEGAAVSTSRRKRCFSPVTPCSTLASEEAICQALARVNAALASANSLPFRSKPKSIRGMAKAPR